MTPGGRHHGPCLAWGPGLLASPPGALSQPYPIPLCPSGLHSVCAGGFRGRLHTFQLLQHLHSAV